MKKIHSQEFFLIVILLYLTFLHLMTILIPYFLNDPFKLFCNFLRKKKFKGKRPLGFVKTNLKSFPLFKKELKDNNLKVNNY